MRQPNGCSTLAPKSSAAKQWIKEEEHAQKKKKNYTRNIPWYSTTKLMKRFASLQHSFSSPTDEHCCGQWPNHMDKYVRTGTSAL